MRRRVLFIALAVVAVPVAFALANDRQLDQTQYLRALNGTPTRIGILSSTDAGSFNNSTTALPDGGLLPDGGVGAGAFSVQGGSLLMLQCAQSVRVASAASDATATSSDVKLEANEKYYTLLKTAHTSVAIRPVSGACVGCCTVSRME